jgi:aminocarboxymuconate-semialdehyde decarboxylase
MNIDMHAHIFTREALSKIERKYKAYAPRLLLDAKGRYFTIINGRSSGPVEPMEQYYDVKKRIKMMDDEKVDVQVLSVTPGNFCYDAPSEAGLAISVAQNDAIANIVAAYPGRFIGSATTPLQDVDVAVEELDRAVKDLGFTSVEIGSNVAGRNLDSLELWPFYEKVQELDIPIIVHPTNVAGTDRMQRYYLSNIIGNPLDTTIAIGSVIFGGILEKYERLKFCWAHGGGFFPYQIGRFDHGYSVRTESKVNISKSPSEYLKTMYFDTITHSVPALRFLIDSMGSDKVLLGTDFPWDMGEYETVSTITGMNSLVAEDKERMLGGNSSKLFKIKSR